MRRQFVTHPAFQYTFTLWFLAGVLILFLLIGGVAFWPLFILSNSPDVSIAQAGFFVSFAQEFGGFLFYLFLFSLLIFSWFGLYLSYKFVGPLARVEAWLEECLANKTVAHIKLRPSDELTRVVEILNRIVDTVFHKGRSS